MSALGGIPIASRRRLLARCARAAGKASSALSTCGTALEPLLAGMVKPIVTLSLHESRFSYRTGIPPDELCISEAV